MELQPWSWTIGIAPMELQQWNCTHENATMELHPWNFTHGIAPMDLHPWNCNNGIAPMKLQPWNYTYGIAPNGTAANNVCTKTELHLYNCTHGIAPTELHSSMLYHTWMQFCGCNPLWVQFHMGAIPLDEVPLSAVPFVHFCIDRIPWLPTNNMQLKVPLCCFLYYSMSVMLLVK